MRISDWSSGVCSSDLVEQARQHQDRADQQQQRPRRPALGEDRAERGGERATDQQADSREPHRGEAERTEEHTSEVQSAMRIPQALFCLKKKPIRYNTTLTTYRYDNSLRRLTSD